MLRLWLIKPPSVLDPANQIHRFPGSPGNKKSGPKRGSRPWRTTYHGKEGKMHLAVIKKRRQLCTVWATRMTTLTPSVSTLRSSYFRWSQCSKTTPLVPVEQAQSDARQAVRTGEHINYNDLLKSSQNAFRMSPPMVSYHRILYLSSFYPMRYQSWLSTSIQQM